MEKMLKRFIELGDGRQEWMASQLRVSVQTVKNYANGVTRMNYATEQMIERLIKSYEKEKV